VLKKSFVAMLLASSVLVASTSADAALNAYLRLKGQKSGEIKGSVTQKGRENTIMVIALDQATSKPINGRTNTGPLVLTKEVDQSSPLLHGSLANAEVFTEFTLQFWRPQISGVGGTGMEEQFYTVKLTNARITNMRTVMLNNKNPELTRYAEYEEVSFTYDAIEWTYVKGGISTTEKNGS
jgi:type VI secretion system secreted protein Hcp